MNDVLQEASGVKIGTKLELRSQHVPAPCYASSSIMHISHLEDFEGTVRTEPERKIGDLLDAHRFVVEQEQFP